MLILVATIVAIALSVLWSVPYIFTPGLIRRTNSRVIMTELRDDQNDVSAAAATNRTAKTPAVRLWGGAAGIGFGLGWLIMAWIVATGTHTGVGMGGFFRWILAMVIAAAVGVLGLTLLIFRRTRRVGGAMFAGGAAMLVALFLSMMM